MPTRARTIAFFHAHPDDEAIFTAGTMTRLAAAGHRVVLIMATSGEYGLGDDRFGLGAVRRAETEHAASLLGVDEIVVCGYEDSGIDGTNGAGLAHVPVGRAAHHIAGLLDRQGLVPDTLVTYDPRGIYGHPDHVAVHTIGVALADIVGVDTAYEATVDREYLHFVETHVVVEAGLPDHPRELGLAGTDLGSATLEIDVELDVSDVLDIKRAAMAAHASQIPADSTALQLDPRAFAAVYGYEWYRRSGPPGIIDDLTRTAATPAGPAGPALSLGLTPTARW